MRHSHIHMRILRTNHEQRILLLVPLPSRDRRFRASTWAWNCTQSRVGIPAHHQFHAGGNEELSADANARKVISETIQVDCNRRPDERTFMRNRNGLGGSRHRCGCPAYRLSDGRMSSDGHSRRQRLASWFVALLPLSLDMSAWLLRKAARLPTHEAGDRRYWRERNNFTINHLNDDERLASHSIGPLARIDSGFEFLTVPAISTSRPNLGNE